MICFIMKTLVVFWGVGVCKKLFLVELSLLYKAIINVC